MKLIVIDENGDEKEIEFCQKSLDKDILSFHNYTMEELIEILKDCLLPLA